MAPRHVAPLVAATALLAAAVPALAHDGGGSGGGGHHGGDVLRAGLAGSTKPTTIFGIQPGSRNWVVRRGDVRVRRDGRIKVRVRGLVFAPGEIGAGTNPLPGIAASLFCNGTAAGTTHVFPFSPQGDARIRDQLPAPPQPCANPTVLLNPAPAGTAVTGTYIASSVPQMEDDD